MESKQILNQIEFKFTRSSYPLSEKLFCYFGTSTSPSTHVPQVGDWVGIFRVGWKSLKEHHTRKPVSVESVELSKKVNIDYTHVVFEQSELPKDKDGYYQFVYVTKGEVLRGVSRPFQFEWESVQSPSSPSTTLKEELKELKREMWNTIEERDLWTKVVEEREREQREREREREYLKEKEQREREREREYLIIKEKEQREREREYLKEKEQREREREYLKEKEKEQREYLKEKEHREREREHREKREEKELREREREQREKREEKEEREREREQREQRERRRSSSIRRYEINNNSVKIADLLESELLSGRSLEKIKEDSIVSKLVQKYLSSVRSKKDEEFVKKFEELFVENTKLSTSLKSRVYEVAELKKEVDELKFINAELVSKLSRGERKVEHLERELEREREVVRKEKRKVEEEKRSSSVERKYERKQQQEERYLEKVAEELDETKSILKEENERLREELRQLSHLYKTESSSYSSLKNKLMKIDETLLSQLSKRLSEKSDVEEATLYDIKTLKKLIEESKMMEKEEKSRIRYDEREYVPRSSSSEYPVKTTINIKEKTTTTQLPKVSISQPEYLSLIETTRPIQETTTRVISETYPSLSISTTTIPEYTKSVKLTSLPTQSQSSSVFSSEKQFVESAMNELYLTKIEEQLKKKKSIEEQLKSKLEKLEKLEKIEKMEQLEKLEKKLVSELAREVVSLPSSEKSSIELVYGKESKQPYLVLSTSSTTTSSSSSQPTTTEEILQKQLQKQQQKYFLKQYEEQARSHLRDQLTSSSSVVPPTVISSSFTTICPVCGIAVSKELNQSELELHVNSHFTD